MNLIIDIVWLTLVVLAFVAPVLGMALVAQRTRHEFAVKRAAALEAERDYWKNKAEQLIDGALMRSGQMPGPVMQPAAPKSKDHSAQLLAGMAVSEFDSRKSAS